MANPARGIALGAAARSFRAADERAIAREGIQAQRDIAVGRQEGANERQQIEISEEQGKLFIENTKVAFEGLSDKARDLTASITSETSAVEAAQIVRERDMVFKGMEQMIGGVAPTRQINGTNHENPNYSPGVFSILNQKLAAAKRGFDLASRKAKADAERKGQAALTTAESGGAEAGALEKKAKLDVQRTFIQDVLKGAGVSPGTASTVASDPVTTGAIQNPVEGGGPVSEDLGTATRHFTLSQAFFAAGMTQEANFQLAQAKFIMQNSPAIQRDQDLDKPLGKEMLQITGLQPGATLRDAMNLGENLPTTGDESRTRAAAAAVGRGQPGAREKVDLIVQTQGIIRGLLDEFQGKGKFAGKPNINIFGIRGKFASAAKTGLAVISDVGLSNFVNQVMDFAIEENQLSLDQVIEFTESKTLSALDILENTIGIVWANVRTKTGRVPLELIRKSIDEVGLTKFKGGQQTADRLELVFKLIGRRGQTLTKTFELGGGGPAPSPDVPRFRIEGGKVVPVQ